MRAFYRLILLNSSVLEMRSVNSNVSRSRLADQLIISFIGRYRNGGILEIGSVALKRRLPKRVTNDIGSPRWLHLEPPLRFSQRSKHQESRSLAASSRSCLLADRAVALFGLGDSDAIQLTSCRACLESHHHCRSRTRRNRTGPRLVWLYPSTQSHFGSH